MKLSFVVPGEPLGVNRASTGGSRPFTKTPEMRAFMETVAGYGALARRGARAEAIECAVEVWIRFYYSTARPDADGPVKPTLDALQAPRLRPSRPGAGIYLNDRLVADYHVSKRLDPSSPRMEVDVEARPDLDLGAALTPKLAAARPRRAVFDARAAQRAGRLVPSVKSFRP